MRRLVHSFVALLTFALGLIAYGLSGYLYVPNGFTIAAGLIISTWYLSALPVLFFLGTGLAGTRKLEAVLRRPDSAIRSAADLRIVRGAINLNMRLAVLLLVEFVCDLCLLGYLVVSERILFGVALFHLIMLGVASYASSFYVRRVERDFRKLRVESGDPAVGATLGRWLHQWHEVRLTLSD